MEEYNLEIYESIYIEGTIDIYVDVVVECIPEFTLESFDAFNKQGQLQEYSGFELTGAIISEVTEVFRDLEGNELLIEVTTLEDALKDYPNLIEDTVEQLERIL